MRLVRVAIGTMALAACGGSDSTAPPTPPKRGIQLVSGTGITDSLEAILAQPLIVEVHDSTGRLAPVGTLVRFSGVQLRGFTDVEARVRGPASQQFDALATGTTDAAGRVSVGVRLGFIAGPARIVVYAPTLGVTDTARYTVVPGAGVSLVLFPGDTAIYVGRSYTLRGGVIDRASNVRNDPLTWSVSGPGISVVGAGVVTASALGRYSIIGRLNANQAVGIFVSVIPQARIAGSLGTHIVTIDLDGANQRELAPITVPSGGAQPRWIPGTNTVIYSHQDGLTQILYTAEENRGFKRFLTNVPPTLSHQAEPAPSANGQWLYFSGSDSRCSSTHFCLYRARIDGSMAELLGVDSTNGARQPAPSPDGTKVAFMTAGGAPLIRVFDVASRTMSSWSVPGAYPAWSPLGTHIAFVPNGGGPLMLMNPDGTGVRSLTATTFAAEPLAWSPDGRWIVGRFELGLILVDAASGEGIPVRLLAGALAGPSVK